MSDERVAPEPGKRLFEQLFEGKSVEAIAASASEGIEAVMRNVERLLGDIDYLVAGRRAASASFLLATADEEGAKIFILIDACRLDPIRHASVLKGVCKAFYDHRVKYAYNAIRRYPPAFNGVATAWRFWTKRWWPESPDPESGEPAMPHDTYFHREMPLYVDWDYYGKRWILPDNTMDPMRFAGGTEPSRLDTLRADLKQMKGATAGGLLSPSALLCVNEAWRNTYVNESTTPATLEKVQQQLIADLVARIGAPDETARRSPLLARPLYHFTTLTAERD